MKAHQHSGEISSIQKIELISNDSSVNNSNLHNSKQRS